MLIYRLLLLGGLQLVKFSADFINLSVSEVILITLLTFDRMVYRGFVCIIYVRYNRFLI